MDIDDGRITSRRTPHIARRIATTLGGRECWQCSWLPRRVLDRNQAVTAITVAELCDHLADDRDAALLEQLCRELGVGWLDAMGRCYSTPHVLDTRFHQLSRTCWCEPATAFDGHVDDGLPFAAFAGDPVDELGFAL